MISQHDEIEIKLEANSVSVADFTAFCSSRGMTRYLNVKGTDIYLENDENVVRLRIQDEKPYELTVKKRKSAASTQERVEVDIPLSGVNASVKDILKFYDLIGFEPALSVYKDAHIFWLKKSGHEFTVVIYDVCSLDKDGMKNNDEKRFIEIEIAKDSIVSVDQAKRLIREWKQEIKKELKVESEALNDSLWEIFTGKKYAIEKEKK